MEVLPILSLQCIPNCLTVTSTCKHIVPLKILVPCSIVPLKILLMVPTVTLTGLILCREKFIDELSRAAHI